MKQNFSRRRFLTLTGGALAAPMVVPSSVLGQGGAIAPSERLGAAVIGTGSRGGGHTNTFMRMQETRVLATCDVYAAKCGRLRDQVNKFYNQQVCTAYQDFRELLARDDIDVIAIASPENWHALHAASAARAGKDIYCEKALTLTVKEGRDLVNTVRRYGRVFQTGTQQRSSRNFRFACELARNGYLGKLKEVRVGVPGGRKLPVVQPKDPPPDIDYELWLGPAPYTPYDDQKCSFNWYFMSDYCAGWIQSWGVHHCDIAVWGAPQLAEGKVTVEGTATFPDDGPADTSIGWETKIIRPDGLVFSFCDNRKKDHGQGCRFIGEDGWVHVRRGGIQAEPASLLKVALKPGDERLYESNHHHGNFLECVKERKDCVAPVEAGHRATTVTLIADIATRLKRKLTFDWGTETFVNDTAANRMLTRAYRSPWRLS